MLASASHGLHNFFTEIRDTIEAYIFSPVSLLDEMKTDEGFLFPVPKLDTTQRTDHIRRSCTDMVRNLRGVAAVRVDLAEILRDLPPDVTAPQCPYRQLPLDLDGAV